MIPTDLELRYDGPIPGYEGGRLFPRNLQHEERALLQKIRERAAEHRDVLERRKDQLRSCEWEWAEISEKYAKDLRNLVHFHVRRLRLIRQQIKNSK